MRAVFFAVLVASFISGSLFAEDIPLTNWPVPQTSSARGGKLSANADVSQAAIFVAITPCRLVDTRNPSGPFSGPAYSAGETRTYDVPNGPCTDLPAAAAYSMNFTIVNYNVNAGSYVNAYPSGTTRPGVSTVNFGTGPPVANAAIVPTSAGAIDVFAGGTTHLIIDVNGYFADGNTELNFTTLLAVVTDSPAGPAVAGVNLTAFDGTFTSGVLGELTSSGLDEGAGVLGYTPGGATWGVKGVTDSLAPQSGGVLGVAYQKVTESYDFPTMGVRGDSDVGEGVAGFTSATEGQAGTSGNYVDSEGGIVNYGALGTIDYGVYSGGDMGGTGAKYFVEPHPTDAAKVIRYVALEGPEAGTYFRGRARFVNGQATIEVPESFRMVSEAEGLTVHVTPVGGFAQIAVMEESLDTIVVHATNDVEFTYIVHGVRRGYADFEPVKDGTEFRPRSATSTIPAHLNDAQKRRLVENGTYNPNGTVNAGTAERLGWEEEWRAARQKERERVRETRQ